MPSRAKISGALRLYDPADAVMGPLDAVGAANFMVSGAVFLMTFYANQRRVTRTRR